MDDLTMTRLCAEAMGIDFGPALTATNDMQARQNELIMRARVEAYNPLDNDAQCMALVKRFDMQIMRQDEGWMACDFQYIYRSEWSADLNRAVVECVAKMQAGK